MKRSKTLKDIAIGTTIAGFALVSVPGLANTSAALDSQPLTTGYAHVIEATEAGCGGGKCGAKCGAKDDKKKEDEKKDDKKDEKKKDAPKS